MTTAILHEIFSGIQGEGTLVGFRQLFVRFHGCNLACDYCDTPASHSEPPRACLVEDAAGSRRTAPQPNPLSVAQVLALLQRLQRDYPHHSVSFTGGEPLLQRAFLDELLPTLHAAGMRSYLETNGVLAEEMAALTEAPHFVAMDIKLPSVAGVAPQWTRHAAFLDAAASRLGDHLRERLQVKLVCGQESLADVETATALIAASHPDIPCILQPVTPHAGGPAAPSTALVLAMQRCAARQLSQVRVIPQTHVMLGQW